MDTFAAFVDRLADSLEDDDATGAELAARACLSRFHFDRVVSAAAGETPSRLRRRVLPALGALHSGGITDLGAGHPMRWVAGESEPGIPTRGIAQERTRIRYSQGGRRRKGLGGA